MAKKSKKKKSTKTLKNKLDKVFSEYIRLRDSDHLGYVCCCTCGKPEPWQDVDCGHFISRAYIATRFEETNAHAQCRYENRYRNGSPEEYALFIINKYGMKEYNRLRDLKNSGFKPSIAWYEEKLLHYQQKVLELKSQF